MTCEPYTLPILNTDFPQTEQVPFVACLPFFSVIASGSETSRWALHLRQYTCMGTTSTK